MKEIFTELYKKVLGFFQAQEIETTESKTVAVNRMKLVLMQDRTNLTPFLLERMKGEMIQVLAKYVEMDQEALELNFEQEGEQMALMLSIPVIRAKDEEEINAAIQEEEAKEGTGKGETEETETETKISDEETEEEQESEEESETEEAESEETEAVEELETEEIEVVNSEKKSKKNK
jgi:cell division topological specificity factor